MRCVLEEDDDLVLGVGVGRRSSTQAGFLRLGLALMSLGCIGALLGLAGASRAAIALTSGVASGFALMAYASARPLPVGAGGPSVVWARRACALAVVVVLLFAIRRVLVDFPVFGNPLPSSEEDLAYSRHTLLAYLHIGPATVYLVGGALQLSSRFRSRHLSVHRRLGRAVLVSGLVSGIFAIVFGLNWSFGGVSESVTAVVFGVWFEACLVRAFLAIGRGDPADHRRWMIRAYATGSAVGTIRVLIGLLVVPIGFRSSFAVGFPVAFVLHAAAAEWVVRSTAPQSSARQRRPVGHR